MQVFLFVLQQKDYILLCCEWVVWGKEVVSKRGFTPRRLPSCGKQRRPFFSLSRQTRLWHNWHPDSCDILSLVRRVPPIPEMKGLALGTLIDLCVYSITYMNQCSWHLHPVKPPYHSCNKETLKSTQMGGTYMVHHRVCVCRAHQRKTIIGFCVQEIIIQVTWN